jgi:hypothetical protein
VELPRWKRCMRAVDWRIVPVLALVVVATATSYGYHRLLLAQRDLIEHTYEVISTLGVVVTPPTLFGAFADVTTSAYV